jgi:hypothetical protein
MITEKRHGLLVGLLIEAVGQPGDDQLDLVVLRQRLLGSVPTCCTFQPSEHGGSPS